MRGIIRMAEENEPLGRLSSRFMGIKLDEMRKVILPADAY